MYLNVAYFVKLTLASLCVWGRARTLPQSGQQKRLLSAASPKDVSTGLKPIHRSPTSPRKKTGFVRAFVRLSSSVQYLLFVNSFSGGQSRDRTPLYKRIGTFGRTLLLTLAKPLTITKYRNPRFFCFLFLPVCALCRVLVVKTSFWASRSLFFHPSCLYRFKLFSNRS